jgi:hypothetical protein
MWAGYAAWHGASSSAWAPAACYALSVGAIWGWRRGRSCGAFCSAWCHIHWWRPSGCREGCVLGDTCAGGRVGVAALGGVPRARRQPMPGVDKSSVAAASHTRAAAASTAMIALQQTRHRRRRRALQHGGPSRAWSWRNTHGHAHCLELPVILLSFACIPACLARALCSR